MTKKIINISLKLKLNPTLEQKIYFNKCFGATRFIYNFYLAEKNKFYEDNIKDLEDKKEINKIWKTFQETPLKELKEKNKWILEANAQGVCNSYMNLKTSYGNFFKNPKTKLPKFHNKHVHNSFKDSMMKQNFLNWNEHSVHLPKIGAVKFNHRNIPKWYKDRTKVCSYTVSKDCRNDYYISILYEIPTFFKEKLKSENIDENQIIGLDFDCDDCYIDSNGKSALKDFGFQKHKQKNLKKLSKLQRRVVRKGKKSKNREKARIKLARFEGHISNCRKDWIEKESLRLTTKYKLIGIEDLSIQGMMKGSRNAKNYVDISWNTFTSKLQWKGEKNGCHVVKIPKMFASSQTCSCCGFKNKEVQQKHLERWTCPQCGSIHQRDENAAKNIVAKSHKVLREAEESEGKTLTACCQLKNWLILSLRSKHLVMHETISETRMSNIFSV